ncbi:MAG TPA: prolipoprotein diacylglyceryl transferase family protein [Blastocatellia bacterium]|nr:prolipoprotein diacylglyceryl transferase family protein [Blastocatellia bacterium]
MKSSQPINGLLDSLVRSRLLHSQRLPAYGLFVCLGILGGFLTALLLALLVPLSPAPVLICVGSGLAAALALAYGTRVARGAEVYSFYHYQLAVMGAGAAALWILRQPVLMNLDVLILSLGITQAVGRLGCLVAGCCFGRPCEFGVCYASEHAVNGFPCTLVGVRLIPIQLIESIWIVISVTVGVLVLFQKAQAGSVVCWYTVLYSSGRFFFEFQRMDALCRFANLTEAQLTSLILVAVVAAIELSRWLPLHPVHIIAAASLLVISIVQALRNSEAEVLSGQHALELAVAVRAASTADGNPSNKAACAGKEIRVSRTSLGLLISGGRVDAERGCLLHYSISREGRSLTIRSARRLARLLAKLNGCEAVRLVRGTHAFHALMFVATGRENATIEETQFWFAPEVRK